jgi:hypothetical protein
VLRNVIAVALVVTVGLHAVAAAQDTARPAGDIRTDLVEGARVGLELVDGRHLVGAVGTRTDDGFYMGDSADAPSFVRYRDVLAVLDPDTGRVIQTYTPPPNHRRRTIVIVIVAAVVGGLAIWTHGAFPVCLLLQCGR